MQKMEAYVRTSSQDMNVELTDVPIPEINDDEVLIKVEAIGVGLHDRYFIPQDAAFPYIIGVEGAGIVVKAGAKVSHFHVDDRVMLSSVLQARGGSWAEYVAVPEGFLVPIPDEMNFAEAAALPVVGKTALESMRALNLKTDDSLFVAGASGAIGTFVIQMATAKGIRVAGSASSKNQEYMLSLGAEKAVDYTNSNWKEEITQWLPGGVSAALAIQPNTAADCVDVVKDDGTVVTVSGDTTPSKRTIHVFQFEHHDDTNPLLHQLAVDIVEGRIRLILEHVYPFEQAITALEKTETRHARGKTVIRLGE